MRTWIGLVLSLHLIGSIKAEIPGCDYFDTVDLSGSVKFPNGSFLFEKLIIPQEDTGEYAYEILADGEKVDVPKHLRGCACKLGNCIRFCCPKNLVLASDERKCMEYTSAELKYDPFVNITLNNGTEVKRHVLNEFIVQQNLPVPCALHYHLDALNDIQMGWKLFEV